MRRRRAQELFALVQDNWLRHTRPALLRRLKAGAFLKAKRAPSADTAVIAAAAAAAGRAAAGPSLLVDKLSSLAIYDAEAGAFIADQAAALAFEVDITAEKQRIADLQNAVRVLKTRCAGAVAALANLLGTDGPARGGAGGPEE